MSSPVGDLKLELVQVLFRHGARTNSLAELKISLPEYIESSIVKTFGFEQLTNIGKAQAYKLGQALRNRYNEFLGPLYYPSDVYAYSSDYDRTKMSLQLVLAGLFPPGLEQTWNNDLKWQPVPLHFVPKKADLLLSSMESQKYRRCMYDFLNKPELRVDYEVVNNFLLSNGVTSVQKYGPTAIAALSNVLASHISAQIELPDWFTEDSYRLIQRTLKEFYEFLSSTTELCKWKIGAFIRKLTENMKIDEKAKIDKQRKIYLYSGHDINIVDYALAHGIKEYYTDYSSAVILEKLRDARNKVYVRMLGCRGKEFEVYKLGKYEEFCPVEEYVKMTKNVTPSDEEIKSMYDDIPYDMNTLFTSDNPSMLEDSVAGLLLDIFKGECSE